jgi:eukaryotic-like serine/threonine-protein kinase
MSMIGKTLAHYEITSQLGKGGMGEVYQAKDKKLGRDVAIKVLPEEFARDIDRVSRFQREAKLLASLNHPNIAAIHGLEESDGTNFLVLELVEGDTLADQIKRGPIPIEESLKLALQIAEALEAAHGKSVIHRDLKPANIKVTPDGKVKVLDFGLAKAFAGDQEVNLSNSPTLSDMATQQGIILGTAAYMSPEQAKGKAVDKRTDIWAFGCVLYEMLTRQAAFQGEDVTEILASVVKGGANLDLLPANLHHRVREALTRCLQKDLRRRYSSITDARYEIEQVLADPQGALVQPVTTMEPHTRQRRLIPWIAAAVVLTAIIAGLAGWKLKPPELRQLTRFYDELPRDQQFSITGECNMAISPDGKQLVHGMSGGLYLRSMDELDAKLIPGSGENPQRPFFSPDGKWVGYLSGAEGQLKKIEISGGAPVTITNTPSLGFFNWGADNTIVYGQPGRGIMRVSANGGTPEEITKSPENAILIDPQILPDGKSVLFTRVTVPTGQFKVMLQSLKSGELKELFEGDTARYLPTGHIVYSLGNNLFAIPFDVNALKVAGGPVSVVEGVYKVPGPQYVVSDSGTLVYVSAMAAGSGRTLVWVDRNGKEEPLTATPNSCRNPRISHDGTKVALDVLDAGNRDIWVLDLVRKNQTRLTFDPANDGWPLWTPDGKRIVFYSNRAGIGSVYRKSADGTGKDESVGSLSNIFPCSWSDDGKALVATQRNLLTGTTNFDIGVLSMEGDHKWKPLLKEKYYEAQPNISPDGRWMAYMSNESGQNQVYVRPFPEIDKGKWQISTSGGDSPLWSPNGRELFYRSGDAVLVVPVKIEPTFSAETPRALFQGKYVSFRAVLTQVDFSSWDINPDGKRFLMMKGLRAEGSAGGGPRKINIVLNWFEELKQRVPVK